MTSIKPQSVRSLTTATIPEPPKMGQRPQLKRGEPSMLNLSVAGLVDIRTTRTSVARTLYILLAVAAFFDFCATVLVDFIPQNTDADNLVTVKCQSRRDIELDTNDKLVFQFFSFLDRWFVQIGMVFSILWFVCAFVRAQWVRDKKLRDLDKQRLLHEDAFDAKTFQRDVQVYEGAWDAYYWTVGIQLLLLPVGFYVFLWQTLKRIVNPSAVDLNDTLEVDVVYTGDDGTLSVEHRFTTHSTHCLLVALLHYCAVVIKQTTGVQLEYSADYVKKRIIKRVLGFAIRHPKRFLRHIREARTGIRWFKYLAPLVGTFNKLLGNVKDLLTKQRQYLYARKARRIRRQFWKLMDERERREAAAIRIQKCYRAMRTRKAFKALQLIQGTKESIAAIRVQSAFRAALARAKTRLLMKQQELNRLQAEAVSTGKHSTQHMSVDDRRRMYELQDELNVTAKKLVNEKMLLRPNTSFAVTWKVLFVICVMFEITQLILKPRLEKFVDKDTGERMDIGKILDRKLVPTPITEWEECAAWLLDDEQLEKQTKGFIQKRRRQRQLREARKLHRPWFCKEPVVTTQALFIDVLRFMLSETLVIIAIVCYLDVFVRFFTGVFDSETGVLEPQPWFARWIIPGLTLQLLVNPRMETTAQFVFQILSDAWRIGPIRVYRWTRALFFPLFMVCMQAIERWVWEPMVNRENKNAPPVNR